MAAYFDSGQVVSTIMLLSLSSFEAGKVTVGIIVDGTDICHQVVN